ncbi:hypothetical protein HGRIS_000880 [Hohenbuehelia grisea]|uniref:Uncharacterized protein n=1 Tax=Hohenbuehelia grisea TaxID=104357 RepID=A0ABR3IQ13_9AGAR
MPQSLSDFSASDEQSGPPSSITLDNIPRSRKPLAKRHFTNTLNLKSLRVATPSANSRSQIQAIPKSANSNPLPPSLDSEERARWDGWKANMVLWDETVRRNDALAAATISPNPVKKVVSQGSKMMQRQLTLRLCSLKEAGLRIKGKSAQKENVEPAFGSSPLLPHPEAPTVTRSIIPAPLTPTDLAKIDANFAPVPESVARQVSEFFLARPNPSSTPRKDIFANAMFIPGPFPLSSSSSATYPDVNAAPNFAGYEHGRPDIVEHESGSHFSIFFSPEDCHLDPVASTDDEEAIIDIASAMSDRLHLPEHHTLRPAMTSPEARDFMKANARKIIPMPGCTPTPSIQNHRHCSILFFAPVNSMDGQTPDGSVELVRVQPPDSDCSSHCGAHSDAKEQPYVLFNGREHKIRRVPKQRLLHADDM